MPNHDAPSRNSLAPQRGPDGRFGSGVTKISPENDDGEELLEISNENLVEDEPSAPKKPSPPKISKEMAASSRKRELGKLEDKKEELNLKIGILARDIPPTIELNDTNRAIQRIKAETKGRGARSDIALAKERSQNYSEARYADKRQKDEDHIKSSEQDLSQAETDRMRLSRSGLQELEAWAKQIDMALPGIKSPAQIKSLTQKRDTARAILDLSHQVDVTEQRINEIKTGLEQVGTSIQQGSDFEQAYKNWKNADNAALSDSWQVAEIPAVPKSRKSSNIEDLEDPMHPAKIAPLNANPKRMAEMKAKRIVEATEKLDPMSRERINAVNDPMYPETLARVNTAREHAQTREEIREMTRIAEEKEMRDATILAHREEIEQAKKMLKTLADRLAERGEVVEIPFQGRSGKQENAPTRSIFSSIGKGFSNLLRSGETKKLLAQFEEAKTVYTSARNEFAKFLTESEK